MRDAFIRGFAHGLEKRAAEFDLPPGEKPMGKPDKGGPGFRTRQRISGAKMALSRGAERATKSIKNTAKAYGGALSTGYKAVKWGVPITVGAAGLSALSAMSGSNKEPS
jgi:hypothetical protein